MSEYINVMNSVSGELTMAPVGSLLNFLVEGTDSGDEKYFLRIDTDQATDPVFVPFNSKSEWEVWRAAFLSNGWNLNLPEPNVLGASYVVSYGDVTCTVFEDGCVGTERVV